MFLAACEGFLDNQNDQSRLLRIHALCVVRASGATKKGGSTVNETDLWTLRGEKEKEVTIYTWGTPEEAAELRRQIEIAHGIKLN